MSLSLPVVVVVEQADVLAGKTRLSMTTSVLNNIQEDSLPMSFLVRLRRGKEKWQEQSVSQSQVKE